MGKKRHGSSRGCLLFSLMLIACASAVAEYTDRLGGNWNNPASAMITNIVLDRMARRRLEKRLGVKQSAPGSTAKTAQSGASETVAPLDDAAVRFRSTGTQLKTREIANLFVAPSDPDNARVFTILKTVLQEFDKGARAAGKPNDL